MDFLQKPDESLDLPWHPYNLAHSAKYLKNDEMAKIEN